MSSNLQLPQRVKQSGISIVILHALQVMDESPDAAAWVMGQTLREARCLQLCRSKRVVALYGLLAYSQSRLQPVGGLLMEHVEGSNLLAHLEYEPDILQVSALLLVGPCKCYAYRHMCWAVASYYIPLHR